MRLRSLVLSPGLLASMALAAVVTITAINHQPIWAGLVVLAVEGGRMFRAGALSLSRLQTESWLWLSGVSVGIIIALNPAIFSQVMLGILYGAWRWWLISRYRDESSAMLAAGVTQFLLLWAIFLGAAVWHWSTLIILVAAWSGSWLVARRSLEAARDQAADVLALAWALIVAECSWIVSLWLVNYIIFNGLLIIPQPALVLTALGYCLAGIYASHRRNQLSRNRLIEYLVIGLFILVVVIAGTKWNGVI